MTYLQLCSTLVNALLHNTSAHSEQHCLSPATVMQQKPSSTNLTECSTSSCDSCTAHALADTNLMMHFICTHHSVLTHHTPHAWPMPPPPLPTDCMPSPAESRLLNGPRQPPHWRVHDLHSHHRQSVTPRANSYRPPTIPAPSQPGLTRQPRTPATLAATQLHAFMHTNTAPQRTQRATVVATQQQLSRKSATHSIIPLSSKPIPKSHTRHVRRTDSPPGQLEHISLTGYMLFSRSTSITESPADAAPTTVRISQTILIVITHHLEQFQPPHCQRPCP